MPDEFEKLVFIKPISLTFSFISSAKFSSEPAIASAKATQESFPDTTIIPLSSSSIVTVSLIIINIEEKPFWESPGAEASLQQAWQFFVLGFEHILIGYDHLLFLFALLVVCIKLRSLVLIVTAFTVAHSLTLALAYFKIVELPAAIVESAIALSIVFVAVENCLLVHPKKRWLMTFLLGLIHGLGFAGVLRELAIPTSNRILSLLTFNLGVEIGQILLVAAFFPLLFFLSNSLLHKQSSNAQENTSTGKELGMRLLPIAALTTALYFVNPGTALAVGALAPLILVLHRWLGFRNGLQIGTSLLIACIGLFWFIERAFFA